MKRVFNRETLKIELSFTKPEYDALTDEQKKSLKSAFLWSRAKRAWVSRAKEPNLWRPRKVAAELGFTEEEKVGERLTTAEQIERQVKRAEARADRYEEKAEKAVERAEGLQSAFNECRKDWSWLTQPNINTSAGRAFTRQRERVIAAYERGFDEYRKSEYFKDRAEIARGTAAMAKLKDLAYLEKKIAEARKEVKDLGGAMVRLENILFDIEDGKEPAYYSYSLKERVPYKADEIKERMTELYERMEAAIDKEGFYQNCMDEAGGIQFSKENIKAGYIVKLNRWGLCEVLKANPKTIHYKILTGGAAGLGGVASYAEIVSVEKVVEKKAEGTHDYKAGDILVSTNIGGSYILSAYKVIKTTPKSIRIVEVEVADNKPIATAEKPNTERIKKPVIRYEKWAVYEDGWPLYRYYAEKAAQ
jgi:hypothetical protein